MASSQSRALGGCGVAAVGDEAVGLQRSRTSYELVCMPQVRRARRTPACTKNALVKQHDRLLQPVERSQTREPVGPVDGLTETFNPKPASENGDLSPAVFTRPNAAIGAWGKAAVQVAVS